MRWKLLVFVLLMITPVQAGPTCLNRSGDTVRCGTHDAMPLGWTLPPEEARQRELSHPGPPALEILKVLGGVALFFALIALMPEFDGASDQDWDGHENHDRD